MKKIIFIPAFLIACSHHVAAQTYVSGGIYTSTTWTVANSPYTLVDTVVVFPGVTLTIEPGVNVLFLWNKQLEIRGTLTAMGTQSDSIVFTGSGGSGEKIYMHNSANSEFNYCKFSYMNKGILNYELGLTIKNSSFTHNATAIYFAATTMENCTFWFNDIAIAGLGGKLINCDISYNQTGVDDVEHISIENSVVSYNSLVGIGTGQADTIINCDIKFNGIGIDDKTSGGGLYSIIQYNRIDSNEIGIQLGYFLDHISCNEICGNTFYDVKYTRVINTNCITNNYWCTTDSATIASHIFDGYDDFSFGLVTFLPLDTIGCYLFTGLEQVREEYATVNLYPNPASNQLAISSQFLEINSIEIYNSLGVKLMDVKPDKNQAEYFQSSFDVSALPPSIYFVKVQTEKGSVIKKLIVQ